MKQQYIKWPKPQESDIYVVFNTPLAFGTSSFVQHAFKSSIKHNHLGESYLGNKSLCGNAEILDKNDESEYIFNIEKEDIKEDCCKACLEVYNKMKAKNHRLLEMKFFLDYEVRSSWFASYISFNWLQQLVGRYFAWKVRTKYRRYKKSLADAELLKNKV